MDISDIVEKASAVRPLTELNEREELARLALETMTPHGIKPLIVEIGGLYGGTTGVLALARPDAEIIVIDTFEWHPEDDVPTSAALLLDNMKKIGVTNVIVMEADSRVIWKRWERSIDLLFIDGGHSFEWVYSDLSRFAPFSKVIALHDYGNKFWESIEQAVTKFLNENPNWHLSHVVGTIAVLNKGG